MSNDEFTQRIAEKNNLRYEIKKKKQLLAKMTQHPEMLSETLILKSEIECLEKQLELIS